MCSLQPYNPLPGVTVVLKGTSVGVVTDVDGHFKMDLPADHETVLVFSFVGMKTQEVYYKGEKELNVVMEEDVKQMDEVVVAPPARAPALAKSAVSLLSSSK